MRWKLPGILIIPLILAWIPALMAQGTTPQTGLTLQDCINTALKQQTNILVGQNTVTSAKAQETQAKSAYFPQVSVQYDNPLVQSTGRALNTANGTIASVTQTFYDGGLREANVAGTKANVQQNVYALNRTQQTVIFNVTSDYFNLLRAEHLASVQDAQVKYLEGQLQLIQARIAAGDAAEVDALPIEAQLATARVDQLEANNAIKTAAIQLQISMGLSPQSNFTVVEFTEPTNIKTLTLDEYTKLAMASRPDVKQVQAGVDVAKASVKSANIVLLPRPVIQGEYDRSITGGNAFSNGSNHAYAITGSIVWDVFNAGSNRAALHSAKANLSSAQIQAEQIGKDIQSDVQTAYLNYTNANERLAATDLSLQAAQKNLDAQEARYKQGLAIPLDLLNAQTTIVTAQSNAVQARYDYYTAIAQLEYATGRQGGLYGK